MKQLLLLIAAALGVWLFVSLADIMLPFIAGFVVAYLLDPLVDKLENIGLPRLLSSSLVMGTFMLLIVILFTLGLPVIAEGIQEAIAALQEQYAKFKLWFAGVEDTYLKDNEDIHNTIKEFSSTAVDNIAAVGQGVLLRGLSFLNILTLIFITPIVSFYLLNDWDRMIEQINDILPPKHATAIREVAGEVEEVLDGFIHGQATICVFLAIFYAAGLYWVGLNGGIAVGVLAGLV
ncbi:MAG: AI-2E family transporter, partial [Candidatus Micropelagos thuwalensis]